MLNSIIYVLVHFDERFGSGWPRKEFAMGVRFVERDVFRFVSKGSAESERADWVLTTGSFFGPIKSIHPNRKDVRTHSCSCPGFRKTVKYF
jgi:hypothetical protein